MTINWHPHLGLSLMQLNELPRTFFADRTGGRPAFRALAAREMGNKKDAVIASLPPYLWKFETRALEDSDNLVVTTGKPIVFVDGTLCLCEQLDAPRVFNKGQLSVIREIRFVFDFLASVQLYAAYAVDSEYNMAVIAEWAGFEELTLFVPQSQEPLFGFDGHQVFQADKNRHHQCHYFSSPQLSKGLSRAVEEIAAGLLQNFSGYCLPGRACEEVGKWMDAVDTQTPAAITSFKVLPRA